MIRSAPRAIPLLIADVLAQDCARVAGIAPLTAALVEGFGILALVPVAALAVSPDAMQSVPLVGTALFALPSANCLPAALAAFVAMMAVRAMIIRVRWQANAALQRITMPRSSCARLPACPTVRGARRRGSAATGCRRSLLG